MTAAADRPAWFLEVGRGIAQATPAETGTSLLGTRQGLAWFADAGLRVRPWLTLTAGAGRFRLGGPIGLLSIPEDSWSYDPSMVTTLMGGVRLQPPIRFGLAPFVLSETGVGWTRWGDEHVISMITDGSVAYTFPEQSARAWCSSVGIGVVSVSPRHWPALEASLRTVVFRERQKTLAINLLRLGVSY